MKEMHLQRVVDPVTAQRLRPTQRDLVHERDQGVSRVLDVLLGNAGTARALLEGVHEGAHLALNGLGRGHRPIERTQAADGA